MGEVANLNCVVQGDSDRPLIVFLHGFMGDLRDWNEVAAQLGDDYCRVAVDLPGHGKSIAASDPGSYEMLAAASAIIELVDDLDCDTFNLVGYSMGGRLALYMAGIYAMRIDTLTLESASPGLRSDTDRAQRRGQDAQLADELETGDFGSFLDRWYGMPLFDTIKRDPGRFSELIRRRREQEPCELANALRAMGIGNQPPLWHELPNHYIPTLLIVGEHDAKYRATAEEMEVTCADMRVQVVPECGHNVHFEDPARYTECLRSFLEKN